MDQETPELRELKKHTRMLAQRNASRAAGGGFVLGLLFGIGLVVAAPGYANITALGIVLLPFVGAFVSYRATMRYWTA